MSTSPAPTPRKGDGYHHGDLRSACLDAALELLAEGDETTLSLRAVARRAGVSPNAPYRHYPDKDALLAALATRGFHELRDLLAEADARAGANRGANRGAVTGTDGDADTDTGARDEEAFVALAQAYVRYAIEHPGVFRLMFGHPCSRSHPETSAAAAEAAAVLADRAAGAVPAERRDAFLTGCWSLVHGLASLVLDGKLASGDPEAADALVRDVVTAMLGGPG